MWTRIKKLGLFRCVMIIVGIAFLIINILCLYLSLSYPAISYFPLVFYVSLSFLVAFLSFLLLLYLVTFVLYNRFSPGFRREVGNTTLVFLGLVILVLLVPSRVGTYSPRILYSKGVANIQKGKFERGERLLEEAWAKDHEIVDYKDYKAWLKAAHAHSRTIDIPEPESENQDD